MTRPRLKCGRFLFEDWSAPDPDDEELDRILHKARYGGELTQTERYRLCEVAAAYLHYAGHPASTKSILSQLRELRRAVRVNRLTAEVGT